MGFSLGQSFITCDVELEAKVVDKFAELGLYDVSFRPLHYFFVPSCLFASLRHGQHRVDIKVYATSY